MPNLRIDGFYRELAAQPDDAELRLSAGDCPAINSPRGFIQLKKRRLTATDTVELMRSTTPEANQREIDEHGETEFKFALSDVERFAVTVVEVNKSYRISAMKTRRA